MADFTAELKFPPTWMVIFCQDDQFDLISYCQLTQIAYKFLKKILTESADEHATDKVDNYLDTTLIWHLTQDID